MITGTMFQVSGVDRISRPPESLGPASLTASDVSIKTQDVDRALNLIVDKIKDGTRIGAVDLRNKTYDYAKKRLELFKHTQRKESIHGLVKSAPSFDEGGGIVFMVQQKSDAGWILEYKLRPQNDKPWFIYRPNYKNQPNAQQWLIDHNRQFARIRRDSQIARTGPMWKVQPMIDAYEDVVKKESEEIIKKNVIRHLKLGILRIGR